MTARVVESSPNRVPLVALLGANVISYIGNNLTFIAIPWYVLQTTGSASKTGMAAFAGTLPMLVSGFFGGAIVDRLGYKRTSIISDLLSGVTVAAIPLLHHTLGLAFWQLLVLVLMGAIFDAPGYTARATVYPDLAILGGMRLERANATSQIMQRVAQIVGPAMAGTLIAVVGTSNVLWIDAATFAASASVVALLVPARVGSIRAREAHADSRHLVEDLKEGLRFIRNDRLILAMMLTFAGGAMLAEPLYTVVMPVYAKRILGSAVDLGLIYAALAGGSLLGNVAFGAIGYRLPRLSIFLIGWSMRAASFWILVTTPSLAVVMAMMVVNGFLFEPNNPLFMTIMQERVPAELRGRVFGAFNSLSLGGAPLGILAYGFLTESTGLHATLLLLAVVNVIPVLSIALLPAWREVQRPPSATALAAAVHD